MITGKLINPQIIKDEAGDPILFDQNFVILDDQGNEVLRNDVSFPYSTPDNDIRTWVVDQVADQAALLDTDSGTLDPATVEWDWPA